MYGQLKILYNVTNYKTHKRHAATFNNPHSKTRTEYGVLIKQVSC